MSKKIYKVRSQIPSNKYEIIWEIPEFVKISAVADGYENSRKHMSEFRVFIDDAANSPDGLEVSWSFELAKSNKGDNNPVQIIVKREFYGNLDQKYIHDEVCIQIQMSILKDDVLIPLVSPVTFAMKPRQIMAVSLGGSIKQISHLLPLDGQLTLQINLEQFETSTSEILPDIESLKTESTAKCLADLSSILASGNHSDFSIKLTTGTTFKVHRSILAARSSVFDRMLQSGMEECAKGEMIVKDISRQTMTVVLQFLYSGKIDVKSICKDNVHEVAYAADKYDLKLIKEAVDKILPTFCEAGNAVNLLKTSKLFELPAAETQISLFIHQNIREVLKAGIKSEGSKKVQAAPRSTKSNAEAKKGT